MANRDPCRLIGQDLLPNEESDELYSVSFRQKNLLISENGIVNVPSNVLTSDQSTSASASS